MGTEVVYAVTFLTHKATTYLKKKILKSLIDSEVILISVKVSVNSYLTLAVFFVYQKQFLKKQTVENH